MNKKKERTYYLVAMDEAGNHLQEITKANWRDVGTFVAAWSRQMELGVNGWNTTCYIQIHIES